MPIYEYECTECGRHFERRQNFTEDPVQTCPECDGRVQRVIQPVGVVFKGSGFYVTDNRRSSGGPGRKEKPATESSSNSKTKSESAESSTSKSEPETSKSEA
jgi:putative FmdB family regulatory protein